MKAVASEGNLHHSASQEAGYMTTSDAYLMREARKAETWGKDSEAEDYSMDLEIHEDQVLILISPSLFRKHKTVLF